MEKDATSRETDLQPEESGREETRFPSEDTDNIKLTTETHLFSVNIKQIDHLNWPSGLTCV